MENITTPSQKRFGKYIGLYLAIILFVCSFGFGFLVGNSSRLVKQAVEPDGTLIISKLINLDRNQNESESVDFKQFWEVWDKIKQKSVNKNLSDVDMFYGAIQGLVYSLGDPYSMYMTPKISEEFMSDLSGEFEGIGAEIGIKSDQLMVVSPLAESPAEKSGLRPGDKILAIDTLDTRGMDVGTAVSKIRGKAGTTVILVISRDGAKDEFEIKIVRQKISVPSVSLVWKENKIAYLQVRQFNDDTEKLFNKYIEKILAEKANGIVLDFRNNPGGYLDTAVYMASEWLTDGAVVSEKAGSSTIKSHSVEGKHRLANMKTVVLINGGSASASEIVAGALQDRKKAILIGEKSFGKGSVQDFETFPDGSALKLTVAEWYTPLDRNINIDGIRPDFEVKEDWDKSAIGEDRVLDKAVELLSGSVWPPVLPVGTTTVKN